MKTQQIQILNSDKWNSTRVWICALWWDQREMFFRIKDKKKKLPVLIYKLNKKVKTVKKNVYVAFIFRPT